MDVSEDSTRQGLDESSLTSLMSPSSTRPCLDEEGDILGE